MDKDDEFIDQYCSCIEQMQEIIETMSNLIESTPNKLKEVDKLYLSKRCISILDMLSDSIYRLKFIYGNEN